MNVRTRTPGFIAYSLPLLAWLSPGALAAEPAPPLPAPPSAPPTAPAPPWQPAQSSAPSASSPPGATASTATPPYGAPGQAQGEPRTSVLDGSRTGGHGAAIVPTDPAVPSKEDIRWADAHPDRVVLLPTAETHPEGTVYLSAYEIVIPQVGYAISDRTQITLTSTPPFGEDLAFLSDLSLKTVIVRDRRVRFAAIGSVSGLFGLEGESFLLGRAGAVVQGCFDAGCRSSVSLGSTLLLAGSVTMNASGVGLVWRATTALSFLVEAQTLLPLGREAGAVNGVGLAPGLRLGWSRFSIDFAAEILPEAEVDGDEAPPVVPFIALTYRFLPSAAASTR